MEEYIATIKAFAFNFTPRGWAFCNGQIMSIAQNTALFSLIGTTYGGNGQTTFALPDLRGRSIVHPGQGPGLSNINYGEVSGTENVTLTINNMPAHGHVIPSLGLSAVTTINALSGGTVSNETDGGNNSFSSGGSTANVYSEPGGTATPIKGATTTGTTAVGTTGIAGSNIPFSLRNPYLGVYMSICLEGIYPSRN
jgi:microcystin-dependent protein